MGGKKLKIVQVIYALIQGGAEKFVVDLSNKLSENHEVYIITLRGSSSDLFTNELSGNVKYINFPIGNGFRIRDIYRLNKFIDKLEPDIIHTHLQVVFYFLFRTLSNKKNTIFHTIHNDASFDGKIKHQFLIRKFFYKRNLIIPITISDDSKRSYENYYKINDPELIYNGCLKPHKTEKFDDVKEEIKSLKSNPEDLVFIHLSRFNENQKQHSVLINAFNRIRSDYKNVILLIVGRDYESEEAVFLKEIAGDGIYFLGETINIGDYLYQSDVFCLSSRFEGLPISLLEAIACGCTPICTPVGGIKDIIQPNKTGYLSSDISEDSYYQVMHKYLRRPDKIKKSELVEYFLENYSIDKCSKKHEQIYHKYINKN
ncbi:glycosyltransferase family 4 protein [Algoriphagus sp. AGSA1]|uniref:glycosyltransferase family 4 protein n=1 Tax=Algoriphagus sp. AGSA1 TaxID=2907213 RepID=UPI001F259CD7|nr:glycosyltransferase family 4 protein [Algoriphagus sp. AGSA1]MCE7053271.1 glycosyltransferase family 4 protein [Algoriphagus sp. AGSA1]